MKTHRNSALGLITVLVLASAGIILRSVLAQFRKSRAAIPVTRARRGDLDLRVYTIGELRTTRTATLVAPPMAGGTLQILNILKTGTPVKAGDAIIEFDPSEQQYEREQSRSEVLQAEQEMVKTKAELAVGAAEEQAQLLKAQFGVRQAEMDVNRNELVSAIDARQNLLKLEGAKDTLAQVEMGMQSNTLSRKATLVVAEEKLNKARFAMRETQENIANMRIRSPIAGLVEIEKNPAVSGGFLLPGMSLPEYHDGDRVFPGTRIAQVLDMGQIEVHAKLREDDWTDVEPAQPVEVHVDALPGETFSGKVKTVSGAATGDSASSDTARKFGVTIQLDRRDARLRPGFTVHVVILGRQLKNVLYLPRQAVFTEDGKAVAYVKKGGRFEARVITTTSRNESRVAIAGLEEGAEVALVNPEFQGTKP